MCEPQALAVGSRLILADVAGDDNRVTTNGLTVANRVWEPNRFRESC